MGAKYSRSARVVIHGNVDWTSSVRRGGETNYTTGGGAFRNVSGQTEIERLLH